MKFYDVIIIGAGASGLFCAIEAGKRYKKVLILDHANKAGKKILMSGGGKCNFTNLQISPNNFLSQNPHFCKSALSRYTQWDFIELVKKHGIPYHEKTLGQLFCDNKSKDILNMLLTECDESGVEIRLNTKITNIDKGADGRFKVKSNLDDLSCKSLVIATGGLSIPTMGATPFGYQIAKQFGLKVLPTRAGLVPFTLQIKDKEKYANLIGIPLHATVRTKNIEFSENILITHRGISGPAILQISSHWCSGDPVEIKLLPNTDLFKALVTLQTQFPNRKLKSVLAHLFPKRVVETFVDEAILNTLMQSLSNERLKQIKDVFQKWIITPSGTEGYRTAEVTIGGVDCNSISSKTMEANDVKGLYFIGEVLDVTGWLGGYNFQWAWSSGWAAGQAA